MNNYDENLKLIHVNSSISQSIKCIKYLTNYRLSRNISGNMSLYALPIRSGLPLIQNIHFIDIHQYSRVLLASVRNLTRVDGYQAWRESEHGSLSKLVQARLNALQNPSKPCAQVRRLTYYLNKRCGYACQIHGALRSFLFAYIFGRTMNLVSGSFYV